MHNKCMNFFMLKCTDNIFYETRYLHISGLTRSFSSKCNWRNMSRKDSTDAVIFLRPNSGDRSLFIGTLTLVGQPQEFLGQLLCRVELHGWEDKVLSSSPFWLKIEVSQFGEIITQSKYIKTLYQNHFLHQINLTLISADINTVLNYLFYQFYQT